MRELLEALRRDGFRAQTDSCQLPSEELRIHSVRTTFMKSSIPTAARVSDLSAPAKRRCASENIVKKRTERRKLTDELRREYDLSKLKGVRGKCATRYQAGTNLVLLSPDVAEYFRDEQSVNTALRKLIHVTRVKKIP
jgi:hypothetical protein